MGNPGLLGFGAPAGTYPVSGVLQSTNTPLGIVTLAGMQPVIISPSGLPSNFSWINQAGATLTPEDNYQLLTLPTGSGDNWRSLAFPVPSIPYTISAQFLLTGLRRENFSMIGIGWRNSSALTRQHLIYGSWNELGYHVTNYSNDSGGYSGHPAVWELWPPTGGVLNLRIGDDGVNRSTYFSQDGKHWNLLYQAVRTDYLTPDQVTVTMNPCSIVTNALWLSWSVTH